MAPRDAETLPEEIILDVVSRLPTKSIGQFRCVSQRWCSLLSDQQFMKAHFAIHSLKQEDKFIFADGSLFTVTFMQDPQNGYVVVVEDLYFPDLQDNWVSVDGSCNGLVLAIHRKNIKYLINPTTLKYHEIPNFHLALPVPCIRSMYGFGYDIVSDDYKVVALSHSYDENVIDQYVGDTFVDVYSARQGLWTRLDNSPYDHSFPKPASGVLVNGALHWLASQKSDYLSVIVAFDLSDEKLYEVPAPDTSGHYFDYELVLLRGCLSISTSLSMHTSLIWIMKDYGVKESWTMYKIDEPSLHEESLCTLLCSMSDDDIVLDVDDDLVVYNMKENRLRDLTGYVPRFVNKAQTFRDSLVSPPNPTMAPKNANLPQEIIFDIIFRLPTKSIGQFRCVSKLWCSLLSDPQFIKAHYAVHSRREENKLILNSCGSLYTISFTCNPQDQNESDVITEELNFQQLQDNWIAVAGSCNGLVLAVYSENIEYLINPTTLKYHEIPSFHLALSEPGSCSMYGLGYDIVSDDYKVVSLSYYDTEEPDSYDTFVDIYSVRKARWRRLESSPYRHSIHDPVPTSGVLVNGALHWLASETSKYSAVIAAFDLSDEKFYEVPTPDTDHSYFYFDLVAFRGCLSMSCSISENTILVWMMKDYGVKESWTSFKIEDASLNDARILLCSMNGDDIVMDVDEELAVYNMKEKRWRDLTGDETPLLYKPQTFMDSLVSPSFSEGIEG